MRVSKSRKGVALIMAMSVVLIGGLIIALAFNMVYTHGWLAEAQKDTYVNHTTLLSVMQATKGLIIAENEDMWETQHAPGLWDGAEPADGSLTLADLRFDDWSVQKQHTGTDLGIGGGGVGNQYVDVDVYDMFYEREWINPNQLSGNAYFPPIFNMTNEGGGGGSGGDTNRLMGTVAGEATSGSSGTGTHGTSSGGIVDPRTYGAYLIRARLYESNRADARPIRTMEEAFVQILPRP